MLNNVRLRSYSLAAVEEMEDVKGDVIDDVMDDVMDDAMEEVEGHARPKLAPDTTTFGPRYLEYIWQTIEREGMERAVFYDGAVRSADALAELLSPSRAWAYCFERDGEVLGLWWCNGHTGHAAQIHFCFFAAGQDCAHELGMMGVRFIMNAPERTRTDTELSSSAELSFMDNLSAPVSVLCGLTPAPYRHAVRYAMGLGFQKVAQLPRATYLAPDALGGRGRNGCGRYVDTVLTVLKREDLL